MSNKMSGGNLSVCCVPNVCSSVGNLPFSHESIRDVTRDGARSETAPLGDHSKGRSSGGSRIVPTNGAILTHDFVPNVTRRTDYNTTHNVSKFSVSEYLFQLYFSCEMLASTSGANTGPPKRETIFNTNGSFVTRKRSE